MAKVIAERIRKDLYVIISGAKDGDVIKLNDEPFKVFLSNDEKTLFASPLREVVQGELVSTEDLLADLG